MLLPNGTVLVAGGETDNACNCPIGRAAPCPTAQIYKPGYLFRGPQPTIGTLATNVMNYNPTGGTRFTVPVSLAPGELIDRIRKVVLMRLPSVTHSFNSEQRAVELTIITPPTGTNCQTPGNCSVTVSTPGHANIAPPGYYMLFVIKDSGDNQVPSQAKFVRLQL